MAGLFGVFGRLRGRLRVCCAAFLFAAMGCFPSLAAACAGSGYAGWDGNYYSPYDYAFGVAMMLRGADVFGNLQFWREVYLEHAAERGDSVALSLHDRYGGAGWGGTFSEFGDLCGGVSDWLASIGYAGSPGVYAVPLGPQAFQDWFDGAGDLMQCVRTTPIGVEPSDAAACPSGYAYSFSVNSVLYRALPDYSGASLQYEKCNFYLPDGLDVVLCAPPTLEFDKPFYRFYCYEDGGMRPVDAFVEGSAYDAVSHGYVGSGMGWNDGLARGWQFTYGSLRSIPLPVFPDTGSALDYFRTGFTDGLLNPGGGCRLCLDRAYPGVCQSPLGVPDSLALPDSRDASCQAIDGLVASMADTSAASLGAAFHASGVTFSYPYRVDYYYDGVLRETRELEVTSSNNVVTGVPVSEDGFYRLADIPYRPALPCTIDGAGGVVEVHYVSRAASSVVGGVRDTFSGMGGFLLAALPVSVPIVGVGFLVALSLKIYRRLVHKA